MISLARISAALLSLIALVPAAATAQVTDSLPGARIRFDLPALQLREPATLRAPWLGAPSRGIVAFDSAMSAALDSSRIARGAALRTAAIYGVGPADTAEAPPPVIEDRGVIGVAGKYADLSLEGQASLSVRTERVRNERCTQAELNDPNAGCSGRIRLPKLENQISVRSGGTIGQRVHVFVDYDADRDFNANNNIQVYYEGLSDEIVRRVEVGSVTFRPPPSRFLTAAVPSSNFGINGLFEVGPMQFQTLFATQKGSAVAQRVFTVGGGGSSQPQDRAVRDLDFEARRFFWVVDPQSLPGYPALDILALDPSQLPAAARPAEVRVYRYRAPTTGAVNPNLGGIHAFARNPADPTQTLGLLAPDEGVEWELLVEGRDYYLDPSALWFVLAARLDTRDYLAVSYTTPDGGTVGSFPAADRPGEIDSLALIVEPLRGPEAGTFRHEMRQVYRVAGSDLQRASLDVSISLNRSERPAAGATTYLAQLGLAIPTDPGVFDRENRVFPRLRDPGADAVVGESYVVFPHLQPFADPARLTPAERSDSLYRTPLYLLFTQGPPGRFQVRLRYDAVGGTDRSTLSLDALQIKENSEQLTVDGRVLQRGTDYSIDYGTGLVTFSSPDALFGSGASQVTARFEQQDLFAVAPTTILGLTSSYSLGTVGAINFIGVFQREATAYNRPQLGFEAKANLIAGVNTALRFRPGGVTRFLDRLTSAPAIAPSQLDINAELALSRPDPNRSGAAYLEEFEADLGTPISLGAIAWEFGSMPQRTDGLDPLLGIGPTFDPADAVQLTWQNLVPAANGQPFQLRPQDIDTTIVIAGRGDQFETALFVTFHSDTAGGFVRNDNRSQWTLPSRPFRPRWRSMVTSLSSTGIDLSRSEYLEFWVFQSGAKPADSAGLQMVIDLGAVSEDVLALAPETLEVAGTDSLFEGRQYVGVGRLDSERAEDGIFNAAEDDIGILGDRPDSLLISGERVFEPTLCTRQLTSTVQVFPWGDLSARCTNGNGHLDTEDLNGDLLLDARGPNESVFRYVVNLADERYKVPNRGLKTLDSQGREAGWTLYRVPLRGPDAIELGAPTLRLIQHLRFTFVAPPDQGGDDVVARFVLARMRFVGAPWVRRAETPITGIEGSTGEPHGEVVTAIVSTENTELGYTSPPGAANVLNDRNAGQSGLGTQVNEKSLRIIGRDLLLNERAEAYLRFPAGSQNLLNYRELRVWTRGYGAGWERGDLQAFVKLGSDDRNFYMYRAPANTTSWEPEMIVDLDAWRRLRSQLEVRWLNGEAPSGAAECGGDPTAYVICEGPYIVHLGDPGINPPNLAAVQELAAGVMRVADFGTLPEAEVWIGDIRLTQPIGETGRAMAVDARLLASDVGDLNLSLVRQDGQFRQIGQTPTFRTTNTMQLAGSWRLDRFLPASLGIAMPINISHVRTGVDPQLLSGTDIRGDDLAGLRRPGSASTVYALTLRRSQRGTNWLVRGLVDPLTITANMMRGRNETELSEAESRAAAVNASYNLVLGRSGPVFDFSRILPGFLRTTEGGTSLRRARITLAPSNIRLQSGLTRDEGEFTSFQVPIERDSDADLIPNRSLNHVWRNAAGLTWQPLGMLVTSADLASTRDLREYSDSTPIGRLAGASRRSFLGTDVGVERDRQLATSFALTPRLTSWLRPRYTTRSSFVLSRNLTSRPLVRLGDDTLGAFILPQTLNNSRGREIGLSIDVARAARGISGETGRLSALLARFRPIDLSTDLIRSSTFDLAAFDPDLRYQLALGDREDFLTEEGVTALSVGESKTRSASTGADLPFGLSFTIRYSETDALRFQNTGLALRETHTISRDWPVATLRFSRTFRNGPLSLLTVAAQVRDRTGSTTQPTNAGTTVTGVTSTSFAPDLSVSFRNGMRLAVQLSNSSQESRGTSASTFTEQDQTIGTLSHTFRMPSWLSRSRKRVSATLLGRWTGTDTCLQPLGSEECNDISNTVNNELTAGFRTDISSEFEGGLDFGYTLSEAGHLNRRISTMFLAVNFTLRLFAGNLQ